MEVKLNVFINPEVLQTLFTVILLVGTIIIYVLQLRKLRPNDEPILYKGQGAKVRRPGLWSHRCLNLATQSWASTSESRGPPRSLGQLSAKKKNKGSGHTYPFLGPIKMVRRFLNIFGRYVWGDLT